MASALAADAPTVDKGLQGECNRIAASCKLAYGNILVSGANSPGVAVALSRQLPKLKVLALVPDRETRDKARSQVFELGLHGKVKVMEATIHGLEYPPLYFDLIFHDMASTNLAGDIERLFYFLKPGRRVCLRVPGDSAEACKRTMLKLGLAQGDVHEGKGAYQLAYQRPPPDPERDWGSWQRDAEENRFVDIPEFTPPLKELFSYELETNANHSNIVPVTSEGVMVYHHYRHGKLKAHDAYTGELIWVYDKESALAGRFSLRQGEKLKLPAATGGTVVITRWGGKSARGPVSYKDYDAFVCFDIHTGNVLWTKPLPQDARWDRYRRFSTYKGQYYLPITTRKAILYEPKTGKETEIKPILPLHEETWKAGSVVFVSPFKVGPYLFKKLPKGETAKNIVSASGDPIPAGSTVVEKDGKVLYRYKHLGAGPRRRLVVSLDKGVFTYSDRAYDLDTGKMTWVAAWMGWTCGGVTVTGDYLWDNTRSMLYARHMDTGQIVWRCMNANNCLPPTIANGVLYSMTKATHRMRAYVSANILKVPAKRSHK